MADTFPRAPAAVVLLLAPAGAAQTGEQTGVQTALRTSMPTGLQTGLVMHLDGQAAPLIVPQAGSDDLLQLASRLLQAASAWLVTAADPTVSAVAQTAVAASTAADPPSMPPLKAGPFHVDGPHRLVRWRGPTGWRPIDLTDIERRLLRQLLAAAGQVCSRSDIAAGVWGTEAHNLRTVDQCVRRLRRSMVAAGVPDCIKTVRGVGYRLVPAVASPRVANHAG